MNNILELLKNEKVEWKKLGEVCEIKNGELINKKFIDMNKGEYPVINSGKEPLGFINKYNTENDPIGITTRGINVGSVTYQEGRYFRGNLNYSVTIIDNKLTIRFLFHLLNEYQPQIKKLCSYSGIPALNSSELKKLEIPIPSLETQEKIVKILDTFTELIKELKKELELRKKQYNYYRDKLLSEDYLNKHELAGNVVEWKKLGDVANIQRGASPRPISNFLTNDEKGVNWIKISDTTNSKYITSTKEKITEEGAKKSRVLKKGTLILSNFMSYGKPFILKIDGAIHDGWAD